MAAKAPKPHAIDRKGRYVSTYDPDIARTICERIAEGETLSAICKGEGMPDRKTFRRWVVQHENVRVMYDAARELKAHSLFDEALDVTRMLKEGKDADDTPLDNVRVNGLRVALDNLRWAAGKLNPREYGERSQPGAAIAIQITTPLNLGATDRTTGPAPGENLYTISASFEPVATGPEASAPDGEPVQALPAPARRNPHPPRKQHP